MSSKAALLISNSLSDPRLMSQIISYHRLKPAMTRTPQKLIHIFHFDYKEFYFDYKECASL